jgi:putative ABC transport system permease protein
VLIRRKNEMTILLSFLNASEQGLIWTIMALGVYITFRILNFADMTVDGSITLGGSVSAMLITIGINPFLSLLIASFIGVVAGALTGFLHTKLKIPAILSGILTMVSLYSINIRIMGGANASLIGKETVFSKIENLFMWVPNKIVIVPLIIALIVCTILMSILWWFFNTEIGLAIRATGDNEHMIRSLGVNTNCTKTLALMISNGLVALCGAIIAQSQGYADISMGTGSIVIGLASIIIGEVILGQNVSFALKLVSVVIGSICYRIIIALILNLGINPSDLKIFTAIILACALCLPNIRNNKILIKKDVNRCCS